MKRTIAEVATEMEELNKWSHGTAPDLEGIHGDADNLLIEALSNISSTGMERIAISRLIGSYKDIRKWYA